MFATKKQVCVGTTELGLKSECTAGNWSWKHWGVLERDGDGIHEAAAEEEEEEEEDEEEEEITVSVQREQNP